MTDRDIARRDAEERGRRAQEAEREARRRDAETQRQTRKDNAANANRKVQKSTGK